MQRRRGQAAGYRVFGSMPGAYGAGLQALIDEKRLGRAADLAEAYMIWGAFAYGAGKRALPTVQDLRRGFRHSKLWCKIRTTASMTCWIRMTITSLKAG